MEFTDEELAEFGLETADNGWPKPRRFGLMLTIAGAIGLWSSLILAIEKAKVLADPHYTPSCSINPLVTCGDALGSWQGSLFGFPNPYLGLIGFTLVIVLGVLLLAQVTLPRFVLWGLAAGSALAFALIMFLVYTSLYELGKLCPYCMLVWAVVFFLVVLTPVFAWSEGRDQSGRAPWLVRNRALLVTGLFVVILAWIFIEFAENLSILLSIG